MGSLDIIVLVLDHARPIYKSRKGSCRRSSLNQAPETYRQALTTWSL